MGSRCGGLMMSLCISSCTFIHSASCLEAFVWVASSGFSKPPEQKYFFINAPSNFSFKICWCFLDAIAIWPQTTKKSTLCLKPLDFKCCCYQILKHVTRTWPLHLKNAIYPYIPFWLYKVELLQVKLGGSWPNSSFCVALLTDKSGQYLFSLRVQ